MGWIKCVQTLKQELEGPLHSSGSQLEKDIKTTWRPYQNSLPKTHP